MKIVKQNPKTSLPVIKMIYHLCRIILGAVLIYASIDKIVNPEAFGKIIYTYQLLPGKMINIIAIILPWLELIVGMFLIFQLWVPGTVLLTNALFMVFIGAIISALLRGLNIDCGCFSTSGGNGSMNMVTFFRDFSFVIMAFSLLVFTFLPQKIGLSFRKEC
ncbi:MAG: DoxX family protein [Desulfobacula sp.]|nr:DoxX family protein [Desulfobacula sp.]